MAGTCLAPLGAQAQFASDTWKVAPTDGQYNNAANWVGGNIPASSSVGTLYTATFGTSSITTIAIAAPSPPELYVGSFQFNAGASAYTFNVADGTNLRFHGAGIVNNSSNAPTFNLNGSSSNLWLGSAAKAGNAIINITNGGDLLLGDTASAENAVINVTGSNSAGIEMFGGTLGDATVTLSGDGSTGLVLRQTASGGSARVIANGGSINIANLTGAGTTLGSLAGASTSFNVNLGSKQLTVGGNNDSTSFAGRLNGSGGSIGKAGTGTWTLTNGTHTYDGLTTISGGTLALSGNGNLANSSGIALTSSGTTFDISAANGNRTIKDLSGVTGSAVVLGTRTLTVGTANDTVFAGDISGTGGLTKQGSGTLTLSGSNAYTGATTIAAGTLALSGVGDISASSGVNLTGATAQFDISASGGSTAIKDLAGVADSKVILGGNSLAVGSANSTTFAGVIEGGSGGLIKQGTGTLTLTAVSTYTGATQINGGTLALSGSGSIALSSSLTLDGTGVSTVFDISQTSGGATVGSLLDVPSGPLLASTAVVRLGSKTLTITELAVFAGTITDGGIGGGAGGGLTIAGVGGAAATAVLSGTNTYTGATTIGENATLELDDNGSISYSSVVNLTGAGAVFDISCGCLNPQTIKDLQGVTGTTVRLGDNSLTVGTANSTTFEGIIDAYFGASGPGTGGLIKQGSGTLTLGGANTYTGKTMINAGTLKLTNADAVAASSGVTVAIGATLDVSGTSGLGYARVQTLAGGGTVQLGDSGLEITNGSTEFSGAIVDGGNVGGLRISGGTLTLSGTSTYTNLTEIQQGATLALKGAGSIAASSRIEFKEVTSGVATFDISQTDSGASVVALVENRSAIGVVALGSKELTLTGTATDFQGEIQDGGIGGGTGGKLTLASGAEATLRGFNTYTGATTINDGATLKLADFGSIHRSSVVDLAGAGATFDIGGLGLGGVATIRNLAGNGTVKLGGSALELSHASGEFAGKIVDDELGGVLGGEFVVTSGSFTLTGQSTYTGMTAIGSGATLSLKGAGSIAQSLVIYFDPRGPSVATFDISQTTNGASVKGLLDFVGLGVVELGSKTLTVTSVGNFLGTINGAGGGLTLAEAAQLGLGGVNTYTGVTTIGKNATLALFDDGSIAASSGVRLIEAGATLDISCSCGGERTVQNLEGVAGSLVRLGDNNLVVASSVDTTFAGVIVGRPSSESITGGLIKHGNGTLTLSGTNTYTGGTTIDEGIIAVSRNSNLGGNSGSLTFNGGTLRFLASFDLTTGRTITLGTNGGTIDTNGFNTTIAQGIGGDGGLAKQGGGTLTLGGSNTYTGATTVSGGTLALSGSGSLATSSGVALAASDATFDISGANGNRTIQDLSGVAGTFVVLGGNSLTVGTANSTSFAGNISGTGGLTKQGSGTLILTGTNNYTGGTTVSAGTLQGNTTSLQGAITNNAAVVFDQATNGTYAGVMSGSGSLTKTGGGTLVLTENNTYAGVTTISGGILQLGNGGTTGAIAGNVINNGVLAFNRSDNVTFSGDISGSGSVAYVGPGTVTLTGSSTYTGGTAITGGTVQAGSDSAFGTTGALTIVNGTLQATASFTIARSITLTSPGGTFDTNGNTLTLQGAISGTGGLTKQGAGTLELAGANIYSGATTINVGTLALLGVGSIAGSSSVNLAGAGATFDISGANGNSTIQDLTGIAGTSIVLGGNSLTVGTANSTTFAGVISGAGGLTKQGSGTLTLSGESGYGGATTINAGTLAIAGTGNIAFSSVTVATGATFDISGSTNSENLTTALAGGGTVKLGSNELVLGTATGTFSGAIVDAGAGATRGALTILGGTQTLSGASTYGGITQIYQGATLVLTGAGSIANTLYVAFAPLLAGEATFDISGTDNGATVGGLRDTSSAGLGRVVLGDQTLTLTGTAGAFTGIISGNGGLALAANAAQGLAGVNSYTGATTIGAGATLTLYDNGSIAASSGLTLLGAGASFDISGASSGRTIQDLAGVAGTSVLLGGNSLTVGTANNTTFAGVIADDGWNGGRGGALVKQGGGTLTLTGANTYTGGTTVNGGTLALSGTGSIAASSGVNLAAIGATFDISGASGNSTIQDLAGVAGTSVVLGANSLTVGTANSTNFAGNISGTGGLTKTGSGTTTLSGANSYAGTTTINAGTLALAGAGSIAGSSGVTLSGAGATFDISGVTGNSTIQDLNGVAGTSVVLGGNSLTVGTANSTSFAGNISGAGGLTKQGSGTLTLTGTNSYSGVTTVSGGILQGNTTSLQGAIVNNATVAFNQVADGTYGGAMSGSGKLTKTGAGNLTLSGSNSYAGGTTVSAGMLTGNTTSLQGAITNNATVVFNQAATGTYAGAMSGSGELVKAGTGNLVLTGVNIYAGGTTVSGGTLIGTTTSLQGYILNNATVAFDQGTNGAYGGVMWGTGGLIKAGTGSLTLTGANTYSGGTTVSGGVLQGNSTSLQGNILNNAAVVFDQASNGVYAGVLSGSGTLTKTGAGLLNLTGNSVVGGGTTVSGGTLTVNGSLTSNVTVGAGGAIGGTGTITGLLTLNGGTLAPGNSIGTLNVTGNFAQTGGVYQVEANAGGQSDKIVATGTAIIGGGTTVQVLAAQGTYQRSTTYTILSATGGLTGTYGGVTSNLAFLTPSLSYDANNAFLTLELLQNAFSFGGLTPNQRAVGRTLDTAFSGAIGDFATVLNAMMGLSTAQGPAVLDTISGQPYASFGTVNVLANLLFMNTVGQQMALARTGGPGATRVALAEACEVACDMQEPPRWGAWFSGLGGAGNVGGNYNAGGLTYNLGGAAVGVDYRVDPRFLVGLAFGYSSGRQWVSGFQGLGTTDNYSAVLYASFTQGGFYADALAGYAYSDNRQQRVMQIPGLATRYANGGAGANQFLGQIEAGYKIGFGLTETAQASVTPFARFQTVAASQKGFSEWGAESLNLNVQQQNTTSIRTVLGADLAANLPLGSERSLGVTLRLGWAHDYGDTARPMTAAFAGAPTVPFTIVGAQPMRDGAVVGFGLSTKITDSISAYARYDGELNGRDDNHNFSAGFRMTW